MFIVFIILSILLPGSYILLIFIYSKWFNTLKSFAINTSYKNQNNFSIIIPARNEETNIANCLNSILQNNYSKSLYEVIVIDDHSTDATAPIVKQFIQQYNNIQLLQLAEIANWQTLNSYKKKAIELAIAQSKNNYIITTDADCIIPKNWLLNFDAFIQQTQNVFIAAPVQFINSGSFLSIFQCLDFLSLQGITAAAVSAGSLSMCNGANLCYNKKVFNEVNGFADINDIASGDDMLLMDKIKKLHADKTGYLFSQQSIVQTLPAKSFKEFINQRIRWASKATRYKDIRIAIVLWLVYFTNAYLLVLPFISIAIPYLLIWWLVLLSLKTLAELIFLFPVAAFFKQQKLLWWFVIMQPFHIVYTVVAGWLGKFGTYQWKGRKVK